MIRRSVNPTAYGPSSADIAVTFEDEATQHLQVVAIAEAKTLQSQYAKLSAADSAAHERREKAVAAADTELEKDLAAIAARRGKLDRDAFALAEQQLEKERATEAAHADAQARGKATG